MRTRAPTHTPVMLQPGPISTHSAADARTPRPHSPKPRQPPAPHPGSWLTDLSARTPPPASSLQRRLQRRSRPAAQQGGSLCKTGSHPNNGPVPIPVSYVHCMHTGALAGAWTRGEGRHVVMPAAHVSRRASHPRRVGAPDVSPAGPTHPPTSPASSPHMAAPPPQSTPTPTAPARSPPSPARPACAVGRRPGHGP